MPVPVPCRACAELDWTGLDNERMEESTEATHMQDDRTQHHPREVSLWGGETRVRGWWVVGTLERLFCGCGYTGGVVN
jgi:hypothetical protein